jgi:hypothetical protein
MVLALAVCGATAVFDCPLLHDQEREIERQTSPAERTSISKNKPPNTALIAMMNVLGFGFGSRRKKIPQRTNLDTIIILKFTYFNTVKNLEKILVSRSLRKIALFGSRHIFYDR